MDWLVDLFIANNSILGANLGGIHKLFDICKYTLDKLENAARDFKCYFNKKQIAMGGHTEI